MACKSLALATRAHTCIPPYTADVCACRITCHSYTFIHSFICTYRSLNTRFLCAHAHVSLSSRQMWSVGEASTTRTPSTAIVLTRMKVPTFSRALYRPLCFPFSFSLSFFDGAHLLFWRLTSHQRLLTLLTSVLRDNGGSYYLCFFSILYFDLIIKFYSC